MKEQLNRNLRRVYRMAGGILAAVLACLVLGLRAWCRWLFWSEALSSWLFWVGNARKLRVEARLAVLGLRAWCRWLFRSEALSSWLFWVGDARKLRVEARLAVLGLRSWSQLLGVCLIWGLSTGVMGISPAFAGICFLPDCEDQVKPEADNSGAEKCRTMGYESDKSRVCPQYTLIDYCPENSNYIKCDYEGWCRLNGYVETTCESPYKLTDKCLNGTELYKECLLDDEAACKQENPSYVSTCDAGWALDPNHLCTISNNWGLCCNTCPGYNYTAATLPEDATAVASCDSCWGKRYIIADSGFNQCKGFWDCQDGCEIGSETCVSFGVTKCKTCKRCEAKCNEMSCPEGMDCTYENCTQRYCILGCKVGYTYYCKVPIHDCAQLGYDQTPEQCGGSPLVMCPYDKDKVYCMPDDGKCCEVCKDFPYLKKDIPAGYEAGNSCSCCGKTLYKTVPAACTGYQECPYGAADGANPCRSGDKTLYSACKECPNACPGNEVCPAGAICQKDSCSNTYCPTGCAADNTNYCTQPITDCKSLGYHFLGSECLGQEIVYCPYDQNWGHCVPVDEGDCCRNCAGFPYSSVPAGYTQTAVCTCCDKTFYQAEPSDCSGFQTCDFGGADGATSCQSGDEILYSACKECSEACTFEECPAGAVCTADPCSGLLCASGCATGFQNYCDTTETDCDKLGYHSMGADCAGHEVVKCPYDTSKVYCRGG